MKKKTSKTKKTARKTTAKKTVRRVKPKKVLRRPKCPTASKVSVMNKTYRIRPSNSRCMMIARKFAMTQRNYHQKKFCALGYCSRSGKCTAMAYYCYKLTKYSRGYRLSVRVKSFCKCLRLPIPVSTRLVIYNCKKA